MIKEQAPKLLIWEMEYHHAIQQEARPSLSGSVPQSSLALKNSYFLQGRQQVELIRKKAEIMARIFLLLF